jgi:hypothetical protein
MAWIEPDSRAAVQGTGSPDWTGAPAGGGVVEVVVAVELLVGGDGSPAAF